ncbi:RNA-binding protein Cwf29 [Aspergillus melleus]|uniref:RNA-binding protein Cwf29 n=1 Tax=Aspergillus melleus TaxID=138277 RepID=A0ACC3BAU9_9EURO|nr:RNA-binding protein Cwf29 [Aspergillus melleus]
MNTIRQIQALNKRELENAIPPEASWHADYRDTAYIYIGGLPFDLSEGDIVTIFSQYGEPVHVNLARDKETGKSRGFAWLKYEDQRSTDLAVDNLGGATVMGRMLRVDHTRYKRRDDEEEGDNVARLMGDVETKNDRGDDTDDERRRRRKRRGSEEDDEPRRRPLLKEEKELEELIRTHDEEDPMKEFLIEEKKEEVARALERENRVAITVTTVTIAADMTRVARVLERRAGETTGRRQERSGRIGPGRHHARKDPTETGRQWDLGHRRHGGLEIDMIAIDKSQKWSVKKGRPATVTQWSRNISHQGTCFWALTSASDRIKAQHSARPRAAMSPLTFTGFKHPVSGTTIANQNRESA